MKCKRSRKTDLFEIEREKGAFVYRRGEKEIRIVTETLELEVLPLPPIHLPEKISPFFMVNFEPVVMGGKSRTIVFLKIPCEIGVFVDGMQIDVIGDEGLRYILYGPPSGGYICKNIPGERVDEKEMRPEMGFMYIPLRIKNYTPRAFRVGRILMNAEYLDIYYRGRLALTEMVKLDIMEDLLRVRYMNRSYIGGMKKVKAGRMLLRKEEEIEMRWGP